jgi:hypothetical protein
MNKYTAESESDVARRFSAIAERFCSRIEDHSSVGKADLLAELYRILPKLIDEAASLPIVPLSDSEDDETEFSSPAGSNQLKVRMNGEDWSQLYRSLQEKIGDWDKYWMVFNPTADKVAITGSVADDLADIYRDLKEGVIRLQSDSSQAGYAIWSWRLSYYSHWGQHALNALYTIHCLLNDNLERSR